MNLYDISEDMTENIIFIDFLFDESIIEKYIISNIEIFNFHFQISE